MMMMMMMMICKCKMASTTHQQTLFQDFQVPRISSCFNAKEDMVELRISLCGVSMQGSTSQLLRQAITFKCVAMSNGAKTTCQSHTFPFVAYTAGRQKQREKKNILHFCTYIKKNTLSGEYRRSPRIVELDALKAEQARSQNKGNVIYEVMDEEEPDKGQDILKQKRGRKKFKTDTGNDENRLAKAAIVPSGAAIPEKSKLELLLGILQRRDTHKIFAEPVNPEEVEYYYDVIKEPMDFGTIAKKLNEGSYQTLEEFEHDVFLVSNNAMLFNASNTVYYRQARAMKELATRLFHALKTDPENFDTEASIRRRRTKAEVRNLNCNSSNKNNSRIAARGYRAQRVFDDSEVEKRQTYRPWNSFLNENGSLVSAVYNSPQQPELDEKVGRGYVESLKRFAKDLGPTAQMAAMTKVESYISEALKVWNVTTNRQIWNPEMQIPNTAFASNIKVAPSFKVPSSTPACQNISGDKMDIHSGFSNGRRASMDDPMSINNALNSGISQPVNRVESLGDFGEKMTQSASSGFAPSLHLLGNSNRYQTLEGETMHGPSSFWNGGKVSAVNNMDMNNALNKGKGKLGERMETTQSVSSGFAPSLHLLGDSNRYQPFEGETMHGPSSFWNGGKVSAVNNMDMNNALNKGKGKLGERMGFQEKLVQPMRGGLDSGAAFKDYVANRSNEIHLDSSFLNYDSAKGKLDFTALWNTKSNQKELGRTGMMVDAINVDNTVQTAGLASLWSRMQESTPTRNSGASSSSWCPPAQVMSELNSSQTVDYVSEIGSHCPGKGVCQKEAIADGEGSRYRSNAEQGGLLSELFKPLEMGPQPLTESCFQEETISPEMESLLQQKRRIGFSM